MRNDHPLFHENDIISCGVPWSVIRDIETSDVEFEHRFLPRVELILKQSDGRWLGPEELSWRLIKDRKTVDRRKLGPQPLSYGRIFYNVVIWPIRGFLGLVTIALVFILTLSCPPGL
jgi:hypothetical protein